MIEENIRIILIHGVEPLIAYLFKVMTEVKNIRIILTAKANKIDEGEIRARIRALV